MAGCNSKKTTPETTSQPNPTVVQETDAVAKVGDMVKVDYVGTLEDGTIFDTSIVSKAKEG